MTEETEIHIDGLSPTKTRVNMDKMRRPPPQSESVLTSKWGKSMLDDVPVLEPPVVYDKERKRRVRGQPYERPTLKYDNVPRVPDIHDRQIGGGDLYDSLINVILNHKKEIKKVPAAMTLEGATRYAKSLGNGYRATSIDLNPYDGLDEDEIVVFNKAGLPVVINGYKLANSDFAYRNAYLTQYPKGMDPKTKTKKSYQDWLDEQWGYKPPANPWEEATIANEKVDMFDKFYGQGYAQKMPRKKTLTPNQIFAKLWSAALKNFYANIDALVTDDALKTKLKVAKRLIRPIHLQQLAFLVLFDVVQYNVERGNNPDITFDQWRAILKSNTYYKENYRNNFVEQLCKDEEPWGMLGTSGVMRVAAFLTRYTFRYNDQIKFWLDEVIKDDYMTMLGQTSLIGNDGYIIPASQMDATQKYVFNSVSESIDARISNLKDGIKSSYANGGMFCIGVNDFPNVEG